MAELDLAQRNQPPEDLLRELEGVASELEAETTDPLALAEAALRWVGEHVGSEASLACSFGVEDCVLVDILTRVAPSVGVFYLDTELLFLETYQTRDRLVERYGIQPVQLLPAQNVAEQASEYGEALWQRQPDLCCKLRKVRPLTAYLRTRKGWVTGIRRQQSLTRATAPVLEWDSKFGLIKCNPLVTWTERDVWRYVAEHNVPYNPLHDQGFPSIGCVPCTRAVRPGEDPRAGRWAGFTKTECGLHD